MNQTPGLRQLNAEGGNAEEWPRRIGWPGPELIVVWDDDDSAAPCGEDKLLDEHSPATQRRA